ALELLSRGLHVDLQPALERVLVLHQPDVAAPAAEQQAEGVIEVRTNLFEGLEKPLPGRAIDPPDRVLERLGRSGQIGLLLREALVSLLELPEFRDGQKSDRAQGLELRADVSAFRLENG